MSILHLPCLLRSMGFLADVAQLVERRLAMAKVAGSSPVIRSRSWKEPATVPPTDPLPCSGVMFDRDPQDPLKQDVHFKKDCAKHVRDSYNGSTRASQARNAGSIPVSRSKNEQARLTSDLLGKLGRAVQFRSPAILKK